VPARADSDHLDWLPGLVGVAQLVELRVVVPAVAGSNPVAHPQEVAEIGIYRYRQ
jgi:hypothetical protein